MENASKALLIAGAVLIVILIIGVGMAIFSGAKGSIDSAVGQMSSQEKQIFNAQFEQYAGKVKGSQVKSLYSAIVASDAKEEEDDSKRYISIETTNLAAKTTGDAKNAPTSFATAKTTSIPSSIVATATYEVTFGYADGVICGVVITRRS